RAFAEKGYHRAHMEEIARAARVSDDHMAHIFPMKSGLFVAALNAASAARIGCESIVEHIKMGEPFERVVQEAGNFIYRKILDREHTRLRVFGYLERPDLMVKHFDTNSLLPLHIALCERLKLERVRGNVRTDLKIDNAAASLLWICGFR